MEYLLDKGVLTNTNFKPLHLLTFYKNYYDSLGINVNCPVAEEEWGRLVVLPLYPGMTREELDKIIKLVLEYKNESN